MGTRNLTMVVSEKLTKVAQYGQWDGYPGGQGSIALGALLKIAKNKEWEKFKERINSMKWLSKEEAKKIDKLKDWTKVYPYLSRDCGAQIINAIMYGEMFISDFPNEDKKKKVDVEFLVNEEKFAGNSLFCEWAYVIDLDKMTFEVYEGFNKEPLAEDERFHSYFIREERRGDDQYYPVKLVKSYDLNNLPSEEEFIDFFNKKDLEEEEEYQKNNPQ